MSVNETNVVERNSNGRLRTGRAEVHASDAVRTAKYEPYKPRGLTDIDPAIVDMLAKEGFTTRLVRVFIEGSVDTENLLEWTHRGATPVLLSEIPENIAQHLRTSDVGGFKGLIVFKDLALFKIPFERAEQIRKYYEDIAEEQVRGVNDTIRDVAKAHGLQVKLFDESKSEVAVGKNARQVTMQQDQGE
jgi:hypothetical protein